MCLFGAMPWVRGISIEITQIVAGIAVAGLASALSPGPLNVKMRLGGGTSIARGLLIEMFLTALLVLTVLLLAAERHKSTFLARFGLALHCSWLKLQMSYLMISEFRRFIQVSTSLEDRSIPPAHLGLTLLPVHSKDTTEYTGLGRVLVLS
jgi:glycerol uptake facilitator-like aquaporin